MDLRSDDTSSWGVLFRPWPLRLFSDLDIVLITLKLLEGSPHALVWTPPRRDEGDLSQAALAAAVVFVRGYRAFRSDPFGSSSRLRSLPDERHSPLDRRGGE